ncbi:MAG: hypothetical protein QOH06_1568 [Acidobacteriota bacterium]|jgi:HEAT repeat protein|nr:hypothetical protein [Acidobacteriota bacterium]
MKAWEDVAVSCGLQVVEVSHAWIQARNGPVEVLVRSFGEKRATIVVKAPGPPKFYWVSICPESMTQPAEFRIGDRSFDDRFFIGGPSELIFALLDAETRRLLSRVSSDGKLEISRGEIRLVEMSSEKAPYALPLLLGIAQRFAQLKDIPRRLAENAHRDPEPGVRLQNLLLLIRKLPDDPATAEALHRACSDPSPEIRLRAAREIGAEGRAILLDLAESLADDAVSAEAVSALQQELPVERTKAIFDRASRTRCIQTAHACLEALGRSGTAAAVDALAEVLALQNRMAMAAAEALGMTGNPAAEPPLIEALQGSHHEFCMAVANALGRVGSAAAVLPLKATADRFLLDEVRSTARQAIAEIQSRVQGASPGQLSLAGAEAGQLSLAQAEEGQLSLAENSAGQLSVSDHEEVSGVLRVDPAVGPDRERRIRGPESQ